MASDPTPTNPLAARAPGLSTSTAPAGSRKRPSTDKARSSATGADAALAEIRNHLAEGRYRSAQRLAKTAAARFPDHAEIRKLDRGLNERQVRTRPASGPGRAEELEWLRHPPESARGKWVALVGSEMVAAAEALADVMKSLESMNLPKTPLVHRVD